MSVEEYDNQKEQFKKDMQACYARVFLGSEDGQRVLRDLRAKFGVESKVFRRMQGQRYDAMEAALIEGQRHVMVEVEAALKSHNPQLWAQSLI